LKLGVVLFKIWNSWYHLGSSH